MPDEVNLTQLQENVVIMQKNMDNFFLIVMGTIVFLMQCGFAFLEAGAVRSKNTVNILIKNMLDCLIGGLSYWAIGWAVAYGESGNGFIGTSNFFNADLSHSKYPAWFFQFVFAATAATIVSGSIAERCHFSAYFVYSILITGMCSPKTFCEVRINIFKYLYQIFNCILDFWCRQRFLLFNFYSVTKSFWLKSGIHAFIECW